MAIGLPPKFSKTIELDQITIPEKLVLILEILNEENYAIYYASKIGIKASSNKGMFEWNNDIIVKIEEASILIESESSGSDIIDFNKNKKFVQHLESIILSKKDKMDRTKLNEDYELIKPNLIPEELDEFLLPPKNFMDKVKDYFSLIVPKDEYFATPILVLINIAVFILMVIFGVNVFNPTAQALIEWGANYNFMTFNTQWWRMLTCNFVHIGVIHLLMNCFTLVYIGVLLESYLGKIKLFIFYIFCGITSSMASLWWHDMTVSAGASGSIFGLFGVFLALLLSKIIEPETRKSLLQSVAVFIVVNLMYGSVGTIDNAAHIGGLLGGLFLGCSILPSFYKPDSSLNKSFLYIALLLIIVGGGLFYKYYNAQYRAYEGSFQLFKKNEEKALNVFGNNIVSEESHLNNIQKNGINVWKSNKSQIAKMKSLNLPEYYSNFAYQLEIYNNLRLMNYELIYKRIDEASNEYDLAIDSTDREIELLVKEMENTK